MSEEKSLEELRPTSRNPRILDQQTSETMDRTIDEFGSLDGIIYNSHSDVQELVGGNQRTVKFKSDPTATVMITERLTEPSGTGSMAYGYVAVAGERWPYREVWWPKAKHRAAVIAANKVHADFDTDLLAEELSGLAELDEGMLDLTGFSEAEIADLPANMEPDFADAEKHDDGVERFTIDQLRQHASRIPDVVTRTVVEQFIESLKF